MKYWILATVVFLALAACSKAPEKVDESEADGITAAQEVTKMDCPVADADGNIQIAPGLAAKIIKNGHGRAAVAKDYADVHTTLWLHDETAEGGRGTELWSSGGVNPFQFQLSMGQVIEGWDMGVPCMLIGEVRELIIAGELAYGAAGRPPTIPPNATLLFNIELVNLTAPD